MAAAGELVVALGAASACKGMGVSRATYYRAKNPRAPLHTVRQPRRSPLALDADERQRVLDVLHSPEHVDSAPHTVHARLLDEGIYLASVSTFYRLLRKTGGTRSRRNELVHPAYRRPELLATKPCEVWSWDITKLKGPAKSAMFHLYVILDIFSRCVVGWMIAGRESAELAEALIADTCDKHGIEPGQLTLHADRGASMRSKPVASLLADLGVIKSHSRPYVSDDNPYSESQFKTMKYRPDFPDRFQTIEEARAHLQTFFTWYNYEHRHSGIGYVTPAAMHAGVADAIYDRRAIVLKDAFSQHPNRFKNRQPRPPAIPTVAGINMPKPAQGDDETTTN
jgi:putative transposase